MILNVVGIEIFEYINVHSSHHIFMYEGDRMQWISIFLIACQPPEFKDSTMWSGFQYEWEELSHRISLVQTQLHEDGAITMGMIGGDWSTGALFSDQLQFRMHQQQITDPYFRTTHGESTLILEGNLSTSQEITLEEGVVGVSLRGFRINTDIEQEAEYPTEYSPVHGYTSRGFQFSIEPNIEEQTATLTAHIDWGPQDRSIMNEAMQIARTELTIYWTQIKHNQSPSSNNMTFSETLPHEPPFSDHEFRAQEIEHETQTAIGIRSFSLSLTDQEESDMGSYWRNMGIEITPISTGSSVVMSASNSSLIEEISVQFSGELSLDLYPLSHQDSSIRFGTHEDVHEVGTFDFDPLE
jgi:hypothetical protein